MSWRLGSPQGAQARSARPCRLGVAREGQHLGLLGAAVTPGLAELGGHAKPRGGGRHPRLSYILIYLLPSLLELSKCLLK